MIIFTVFNQNFYVLLGQNPNKTKQNNSGQHHLRISRPKLPGLMDVLPECSVSELQGEAV